MTARCARIDRVGVPLGEWRLHSGQPLLETRKLGRTDLEVTRLGFGGARFGSERVPLAVARPVLIGVLDAGVTFFDTAALYGESESWIGTSIGDRRDEYVIATKCGRPSEPDGPSWAPAAIRQSIERSLERLQTDHVDLVQLHGCSADVLRHGAAVRALEDAQVAGKTRYLGYSGDGANAVAAVRLEAFDALQTSFNLVDQRALDEVLPLAAQAEMGIIIKRPLANGSFARAESPYPYAEEYWRRGERYAYPVGAPQDPIELALRFALSFDAVDTAIVGTTSVAHAMKNVRFAEAGGLDRAVVDDLRVQFAAHGTGWPQLV